MAAGRSSRAASLRPGPRQTVLFTPTASLRTGYLQRGNTLAELAKQCAIDANALAETVERFNHFASAGEDVDFHRGASAYNRAQGDHQVTLGPLREGPFYAVRILPGSLGTFSGLQTDEHARVLDEQQLPIPGLYAIGNDMSSVMRGYYPSGGSPRARHDLRLSGG